MTEEINKNNLYRLYDLIGDVIRNCAFYRANWKITDNGKIQRLDSEYWTSQTGNFLDKATLNWTIIFHNGSYDAPHYFLEFVNEEEFLKRLKNDAEMDESEFRDLKKGVMDYRNKHLAHLDDPEQLFKRKITLFYPKVDFLLQTSYVLYNLLQDMELTRVGGFYGRIQHFYERWHKEALAEIELRESIERFFRNKVNL